MDTIWDADLQSAALKAEHHRLKAERLSLGYEGKSVCDALDLAIPHGKFSVIVGPNGCGKSTLLKSLCRLLKPLAGQVLLDGQNIHQLPTKVVAKQLGLLPQSALTPEGIKVVDLVSRGRYPHQGLFRQWNGADEQAVEEAMRATHVHKLAQHSVDQLSGGQRQRVWVAMALAQQTPYLLLDEPTTYLDIAHQIELLDLFWRLNRQQGHTLVAVLHDLNQACRYADHLIVLQEGKIVAQGDPHSLVTPALVKQVFGIDCVVMPDPISSTPLIIPHSLKRG
ncbi:ABC transporter ATP-binding protein [Vibrio cholerae]|uniref:ABC transporter ATP-binding protein n=1 Tax=Vibrio cholerae TaxID=666 RepID=UPI0011D63E68|nr:ABC transporter ATP-binding protein [Vibrio cholerae]EGR2424987.1 ABC transporter ATP-binding protein [Vibrio cholerae]EGR4157091.1 ABC transporter ATP-binding protein [Vibrio cholerae]EJL6484096.1 ABC transporter ATP-binding protein [Vibrio cholerae]EJL6559500.1 ABC transporter ATP-binding protein [Vibrio cholerae]ELB7341995.1 ABC transporter ATP-binding protein [Vibrio cholerae]